MPKSKMWALNEQTGHIAIEEKWRFEIGTGSEHYWSWWEIQRGGWSDPLIDTGLLLNFKSSLQHLTAQLAVTLSLRQVPSHFKKTFSKPHGLACPSWNLLFIIHCFVRGWWFWWYGWLMGCWFVAEAVHLVPEYGKIWRWKCDDASACTVFLTHYRGEGAINQMFED